MHFMDDKHQKVLKKKIDHLKICPFIHDNNVVLVTVSTNQQYQKIVEVIKYKSIVEHLFVILLVINMLSS